VLNCWTGSSCSKRFMHESQKPAIANNAPPRAVDNKRWRLY
jgi:hypothetical protein